MAHEQTQEEIAIGRRVLVEASCRQRLAHSRSDARILQPRGAADTRAHHRTREDPGDVASVRRRGQAMQDLSGPGHRRAGEELPGISRADLRIERVGRAALTECFGAERCCLSEPVVTVATSTRHQVAHRLGLGTWRRRRASRAAVGLSSAGRGQVRSAGSRAFAPARRTATLGRNQTAMANSSPVPAILRIAYAWGRAGTPERAASVTPLRAAGSARAPSRRTGAAGRGGRRRRGSARRRSCGWSPRVRRTARTPRRAGRR